MIFHLNFKKLYIPFSNFLRIVLFERSLKHFNVSSISSPLELYSSISIFSIHFEHYFNSSEQLSHNLLYALNIIFLSHFIHLDKSCGVLYLPYLIFHSI